MCMCSAGSKQYSSAMGPSGLSNTLLLTIISAAERKSVRM